MLLQNMKAGIVASKELAEYVKERCRMKVTVYDDIIYYYKDYNYCVKPSVHVRQLFVSLSN